MFRRSWLSIIGAAACVACGPVVALLAQQPPSPPWFDSSPSPPLVQAQPYPPMGTAQAYNFDGAQQGMPETGYQDRVARRLPATRWPQPLTGSESSYPQGAMMPQPNAYPAQPQVAPPTLFELGQIIAWVGEQPIQVGDVMPMVEQTLAPYLAKMEPQVLESQREQIEQQKKQLMKKALESAIESKLLYQDFLRSVPADKKDEILARIISRVTEQFNEKELPDAMKKAEVESPAALDAKLRTYGSSLDQQKRLFVERVLGQSGLGEKIDYKPEITHQAMLDDYWENIQDYEFPAKVRWEKVTVTYANFATKEQAWAALGDMGNEILRGAPLGAVAKRHSQGVDAADGGYHDWTSKGSLASDALNEAIFSLPVGQLSERMEDDRGFHIVRVIERTEAGRTPFTEAQVEIKEKLRKSKIRAQVTDCVEKLKSEIYVWTVFDDQSDSEGVE